MKTALVLLAGLLASADPSRLDPTRVHSFTLDPAGLPSRTSEQSLPEHPIIAWRVRVAASVAHLPAILQDGSIIVAHARPSVAKYDAAGRLLWTAWLGTSPAATTPIALADGNLVVLSEDGEAIALSARGSRLWSRQLPLGAIARPPVLGADQDGSVLVALGRRLTRLDQGRVTLSAELDQDLVALLGAPGTPIAVGNAGAIWAISPDGELRRRADLGGKVQTALRIDETRLMAVVDRERLVELDLTRGAISVRFSDPALSLGTFALNRAGEVRILAGGTSAGSSGKGSQASELLLTLRTDGSERGRSEIPVSSARGDFTLDGRGNVLMTHSGAHAVLITPSGSSETIPGTACGEPFRPIVLEGRGALLTCRSGILLGLRGASEKSVK